jgi:hypothetical protein
VDDVNDTSAYRINNDNYIVSGHGVFEAGRPRLRADYITWQIREIE